MGENRVSAKRWVWGSVGMGIQDKKVVSETTLMVQLANGKKEEAGFQTRDRTSRTRAGTTAT